MQSPAAPTTLQRTTLMRGGARHYFVQAAGLPLSLKFMRNGRAHYRIDRGEFAVDDGGYLILNEGQPYSIAIESPTVVESFIVWFPPGWVEDVWRGATTPDDRLLAEPHRVRRSEVRKNREVSPAEIA